MLVGNQHGIQRRGQDFDKKSLHLKGYTAKRLTDKFPDKSSTNRGVNKLLKKLRDTCTVDRRPGSGRLRSACMKRAKLLLQKFPQSATEFVFLYRRKDVLGRFT